MSGGIRQGGGLARGLVRTDPPKNGSLGPRSRLRTGLLAGLAFVLLALDGQADEGGIPHSLALPDLMSRMATMEVMGMGDSKLLQMCGAFLGPRLVLWSLMPGVLIGLVFGLIYTRILKSPHFPFGPSLGLGAFLTAMCPDQVTGALQKLPEAMMTLDPRARAFIMIASMVVLFLLMRRIRRRAAEYTDEIERDYAEHDGDDN